ncbi:MAG: ABC transporter ATP-binding protein [Planctomycetota bacterium]
MRNICDAILVFLAFDPFDAYDRNARSLAAPGFGDQRGRAVVHRPAGILSQEPLNVTMIRLTDISKTFDEGHSYAVRDLSLEVRDGETLVLLGSSGCGKTTTLKMVNGLVEPTSGAVAVNGRSVTRHDILSLRRAIGYVFQGIGLFPHMTIEQNVAIVPRLLGWPPGRRTARAQEMLSLVELDPETYGRRFPRDLSGGEQQRVGVARALAADPTYLLMDEPFGALDAITRDGLQQELLRIKRELGKTIVFVTHDIFEALTLADRIAVMHEGRLEQVGTKREILAEPATGFVEDLFSKPKAQLEVLAAQ